MNAVQTRPAFLSERAGERTRAMALRLGERLLRESGESRPVMRGLFGQPGTALAFRALAQATGDSRYRDAAHAALQCAALADDEPGLGLISGISGLRAAAAIFSADDARYGRLVEQCDAYVESALPERRTGGISKWNEFDLLDGWSGMRLARCITGRRERDRLVESMEWLLADDERWSFVHPSSRTGVPTNDLGMAHGLPGMLASIALTTSELDDGLTALLEVQSRSLAASAIHHEGRILWPYTVQAPRDIPLRHSWCYGTHGVAAALYVTASRIGGRALADFALDALRRESKLPPTTWNLRDHALCHGTCANAAMFASIGSASGDAELIAAVEPAVVHALDGLDADGAACLALTLDGKSRYDASSMLDGAAGIVSSLLAIAGAADSRWLLCYGLPPLEDD